MPSDDGVLNAFLKSFVSSVRAYNDRMLKQRQSGLRAVESDEEREELDCAQAKLLGARLAVMLLHEKE